MNNLINIHVNMNIIMLYVNYFPKIQLQ